MLILNADEVRRALKMEVAVDAMKQALVAITDGTASLPLRTHIDIAKHQGTTLVMPAYVSGNIESLTVKVVSVFPGNSTRGVPRIQAAVNVFDPETGQPLALLEGSAVTAIRTAAASAAATDVLARSDASTLGLLGAGVQARSHLHSMLEVRPIKTVRIWSRDPRTVKKMIEELSVAGLDCNLIAAHSADDAVAGSDVVCTVTTATEPLFSADAIAPGTHLNVVGSYQPHVREVPSQTVANARVFVDEVASALEEAGDLIQPIREGLIDENHILGAIGEVIRGKLPGRLREEDITLFKSVGNAAEDALAAAATLKTAIRMGLGTRVDF